MREAVVADNLGTESSESLSSDDSMESYTLFKRSMRTFGTKELQEERIRDTDDDSSDSNWLEGEYRSMRKWKVKRKKTIVDTTHCKSHANSAKKITAILRIFYVFHFISATFIC